MNKISQKFLTNSRENYNARCLSKMPTTSFLYEQSNITIGVLLTLVAKNKKVDKRHHAAACLEFSFFEPPYHVESCRGMLVSKI